MLRPVTCADIVPVQAIYSLLDFLAVATILHRRGLLVSTHRHFRRAGPALTLIIASPMKTDAAAIAESQTDRNYFKCVRPRAFIPYLQPREGAQCAAHKATDTAFSPRVYSNPSNPQHIYCRTAPLDRGLARLLESALQARLQLGSLASFYQISFLRSIAELWLPGAEERSGRFSHATART